MALRIPFLEYGSTPYTCIGLANALGGLIAGVLYDNYTKVDIRMHVAAVAGKRWLSKEFIGEVFRYPFEYLECVRVTALIPARNLESINLNAHVGFKLEGKIRQMLPNGDDLLVYGMLRKECRWLKVGLKHGLQHRFPSRQIAQPA